MAQSYNLYTDGLKITTTLDSKMQTLAEDCCVQAYVMATVRVYKHWKGYKESNHGAMTNG